MDSEKVTMLRYRGSRLSSKVKKLDMFPKIEETFKEPTKIGGTCMYYYYILLHKILTNVYSFSCKFFNYRIFNIFRI